MAAAGATQAPSPAPQARVSRGHPDVTGPLSREQIEQVVRRHQRGIRTCYERALASNPSLAGIVSPSWRVEANGRVAGARIAEDTLGDPNVADCILREVGRMRFDAPSGGSVAITYPFTFRSES